MKLGLPWPLHGGAPWRAPDAAARQAGQRRHYPATVEAGCQGRSPASEVRVVGIDDWSWWRATSYGTIMIDLERRSVVDILEDR